MAERKVLLVAAELAPLVSVGGVAEYLLGLGAALKARGCDVRVAIPAYGYLRAVEGVRRIAERVVVRLGVGASDITDVYETAVACPGQGGLALPVYLLGNHKHIASCRSSADVYGDWPNHEPWIAFSRAVVDFFGAPKASWVPDVIHCHDAHSALIATYLKQLRGTNPDAPLAGARTLLTIHNLLAQGLGDLGIVAYVGHNPLEQVMGDLGIVAYAGLPLSLAGVDCFEFWGRANVLKAGLVSADAVNAVSRTYAEEICSGPELGFGLEGVLLRLRKEGKLHGIVNGIDESRWRLTGLAYDGSDSVDTVLRARKDARKPLFAEWKWKDDGAPVLSFRSRWDNQKGAGLLAEGMPDILEFARCIVVAWAMQGVSSILQKAWSDLNALAAKRPDRLIVNPSQVASVDGTGLHYTVSDFFLMPSRYEPCGLAQMECQRYGAIPIVRKTGGLADTISEVETSRFPSPNGFLFEDYGTARDMVGATRRAFGAFRDKAALKRLIQNALLQRNGWNTRIEQYEALYAQQP